MEINSNQVCVTGFYSKHDDSIIKAIGTHIADNPSCFYCLVEHTRPCNDYKESNTHYHYVCWGDDSIRQLQTKLYSTTFKSILQYDSKFRYSARLANYITKHKVPQDKIDPYFVQNFLIYCKHTGPDTKMDTNNPRARIYFESITGQEAIQAKVEQIANVEEFEEAKKAATACLSFNIKDTTFIVPGSLKQKYTLDVELDDFVHKANIINHNAMWRLTKDQRKYLDVKFDPKKVADAIERYSNYMNKEGFEFSITSCRRGLPFRYFSLASFIGDDKARGQVHADFLARPMPHLLSGILLVLKVIQENLGDASPLFINDLEQILNKTLSKKTVICLIGASNAGKTLLSSMVTKYVNTGLVTKNGEANQFVFQDVLDKRIVHMEEAKVAQTLEGEYLSFFSKNDSMAVHVKHKSAISLTERCDKPPVLMTANQDPFRDCRNREGFANRVIKYYFKKPLDNGYLEMLKKHTGYPHNIPITPMHYIVVLSMLQNMDDFNTESIMAYITDNKFIETFTKYLKDGILPLNTPASELNDLFYIEFDSERVPVDAPFVPEEVVENIDLSFKIGNRKRRREEDDEEEDVQPKPVFVPGSIGALLQGMG